MNRKKNFIDEIIALLRRNRFKRWSYIAHPYASLAIILTRHNQLVSKYTYSLPPVRSWVSFGDSALRSTAQSFSLPQLRAARVTDASHCESPRRTDPWCRSVYLFVAYRRRRWSLGRFPGALNCSRRRAPTAERLWEGRRPPCFAVFGALHDFSWVRFFSSVLTCSASFWEGDCSGFAWTVAINYSSVASIACLLSLL